MSLLLLFNPKAASESVDSDDSAVRGGFIPQYEGLHSWQKRKEQRAPELEKVLEDVEDEVGQATVEEKSEALRDEFPEFEANYEPLFGFVLDLENRLQELLNEQAEKEKLQLIGLQLLAAERILRRRYEDEVLFALLFL